MNTNLRMDEHWQQLLMKYADGHGDLDRTLSDMGMTQADFDTLVDTDDFTYVYRTTFMMSLEVSHGSLEHTVRMHSSIIFMDGFLLCLYMTRKGAIR